MRRSPEPRVAFEPDALHTLAERVYAAYTQAVLARDKLSAPLAGALHGLGYKDWIVGGQSYTAPETPRRRGKVLDPLTDYDFFAPLARTFTGLGYSPEQRDCGKRTAAPVMFLTIVEGAIGYGLEETLGRDLVTASYDRMYLQVIDGDKVVASHVGSLRETNGVTLGDLGLTDDDYRFELGMEGERAWRGGGAAKPGEGFPRQAEWHDWAIVDGTWTNIGFQGRDWDGEYAGE